MPGVFEAITFIILSAQAGALGTGLLAVAGAYGSTLLGIGISVGLSVYSYLTRPRPQSITPEDVQTSARNPTAPRVRHYGRGKFSGPWAFGASKQSNFHKVLALGTGELDEIEEIWVDDKRVETNSGGWVTTEPWGYGSGPYDSTLVVQTRKGLPTETHYSTLGSWFTEWTTAHRGDGVASLYALQYGVNQDEISDKFPNLINTQYRVVARCSKVLNPETDAVSWSENAAPIVLDYLSHPDGARIPPGLFTTPQAKAGWIESQNRCALPITTKSGGTEMQYRIWGSYSFDERPADVLGRMFAACDGRLVPTPDGGFYMEPGHWYEPTVVIDEAAITGFSDLKRGKDVLTTANMITATYLSPFHDYQSTEAEAWIDEDDVSLRGEIKSDQQFLMAPSHGQCRRLMKLAAYRANPNWIGTFFCNLRALAAFGERYVRIRYPLFGIDEVFEVLDFRFNIGEGGILTGVTLQVQSLPAAAFEWDAATEEGTPPANDEIVVDNTIPIPDDFTFTMGTRVISGQTVPVGVAAFTAPESPALLPDVQYRKGTLGEWMQVPIVSGETSGQSGILEDGEPYQARMRFVTITGRQGDWTPIKDLTPVTDPIAPAAITSFAAANEVHLGNVKLQFAVASDPHLSRIKIYRVPIGSTLDRNAHRIATLVPAGGTFQYIDGDATRTNLVNFSTWPVLQSQWSFAGGKLEKVAGSASSPQCALQPYDVQDGKEYRYQAVVSAVGGSGNLFVTLSDGAGTSSGAVNSASIGGAPGTYRGSIIETTGHDYIGFRASLTRSATIDGFVLYEKTAACAPQGAFNYFAEPFNISNKAGPLTSAVAATII